MYYRKLLALSMSAAGVESHRQSSRYAAPLHERALIFPFRPPHSDQKCHFWQRNISCYELIVSGFITVKKIISASKIKWAVESTIKDRSFVYPEVNQCLNASNHEEMSDWPAKAVMWFRHVKDGFLARLWLSQVYRSQTCRNLNVLCFNNIIQKRLFDGLVFPKN